MAYKGLFAFICPLKRTALCSNGNQHSSFAYTLHQDSFVATAFSGFFGYTKQVANIEKSLPYFLIAGQGFSWQEKQNSAHGIHNKKQAVLSMINHHTSLNMSQTNMLWESILTHAKIEQQEPSYSVPLCSVRSERGRVMVKIKDVHRLDVVMSRLQTLGFGAFGQTKQRFGPVYRQHPVYQSVPAPKLKSELSIVHGLTGIEDEAEAAERLTSIIKHGGLLSYAERRRLNINVKSLSPLGDLGSGIDWAVPFTIGRKNHYGNWVSFHLDPSALQREHLFFALEDFGGGHDRFARYNQYAQSLGQKNIFQAPGHEARQTHMYLLHSSLASPCNEMWIPWRVDFEEMQAIVVDPDVPSLLKLLQEAQGQGYIPSHVKVISEFSDNPFHANLLTHNPLDNF